MAISKQQDSTINSSSPERIKTIVIKLPFDLQERILSFSFLHQIHSYYPEAELHFITPTKNIEVLNLLPFSAYYHEFEENEIASVLDVHRYTVNAKIYNVDLFISLTNSFADACLGIGLRAKKRLGFSNGWKTLLFTHKVNRLYGQHVTENFNSLYKALTNEDVSSRLKVMSREIEPVIVDWDITPYIAINLSPLRQASIEEEFVELINYFENQRIILFASEDQDKFQLLMQPFLEKLSKKNQYFNFVYASWIDLAKMLSFSKGLITFNGPIASFSSYVGAKTLILFDSEDPQTYGPFYFLGEVLSLGVNDPTLIHSSNSSEVIKDRKRFNMAEVYEKSFSFFKLNKR